MKSKEPAAIVKRINHKLESSSPTPDRVRKARGEKAKAELGEYYRVACYNNALVERNVDIDALAKELRV